MSRAKDEEVRLPGIVPREHLMRTYGWNGRKKYPFKGMIIGDYFKIHDRERALSVRASIRSFRRRYPAREFTVRQVQGQEYWICRRVA